MSRDSQKMRYWGGASVAGKFTCGMTNSCANTNYGCNCDKEDALLREDSVLLTDKTKQSSSDLEILVILTPILATTLWESLSAMV